MVEREREVAAKSRHALHCPVTTLSAQVPRSETNTRTLGKVARKDVGDRTLTTGAVSER